MRAGAHIVATPDGLSTLRSEPPISLRPTAGAVYLVGSAAGPVGGDELRIDVELADGADLSVRSAAAQLVHPGPRGSSSSLTVVATVGEGALLDWRPEPTILLSGADHAVDTRIRLASGASLCWVENIVLGRHAEQGGSTRLRLRVERSGRPLLVQEVRVGPRWPDGEGPAGLAGARVLGSAVVAGRAAPTPLTSCDGARCAVLELAADVWCVTVLGDRAELVHRALCELTGRDSRPRLRSHA